MAHDREISKLKIQKREKIGIIGEQRIALEQMAEKGAVALLEEQYEAKAPLEAKVTHSASHAFSPL